MPTADKEEMLRILDQNGNITNCFEKRSVVHQNGMWHQEVAFIPLNCKGEILLQRRSKNKKSYPNCWALCAGHVVGNQSPKQAAVMEANEELGLHLTESDLSLLAGGGEKPIKNEREDNKCFATCFYKILDNPLSFFKKQDCEVEELKWFALDEFENMVKSGKNCIFKDNEYYNFIISGLKKICKENNFKK